LHLPNHKSAFDYAAFVDTAVADLLATGAAREATGPLTLVLPLGVVPKKGTSKFRLIFDARYLNTHLNVPSFKYESLSAAGEFLKPNDFMFTVDLKSGYHHIDMREDAFPYLGFEWRGRFYHFTQLPFGLAPACWAFTKVTRELLQLWRGHGHRCGGYIDDSLHAHQERDALLQWQGRVLADLQRAGFLVSESKCSLEPARQKIYLGACVDTVRGCLSVPADKRERLLSSVRALRDSWRGCVPVPIRTVASVAGTLLSMSHSFGLIAVMMTRQMAHWCAEATRAGLSMGRARLLSDAILPELAFWTESFERFDGHKPLWRPPSVLSVTVYTDAAGPAPGTFGGYGGWVVGPDGHPTRPVSGRWEFDTRVVSSTHLELAAMLRVLKSLNRDGSLTGASVPIRTDSMNARSVVLKGGSVSPGVQEACLPLLWYAIEHSLQLQLDWVPRELNAYADALSKAGSGEWLLDRAVFAHLQQSFAPGGFAVDLFASDVAFQMRPYYAWHESLGGAAVNAFTRAWPVGPAVGYCFPPFALLGRVLAYARECGARLCLIAPFWPGAAWWPSLVCVGGRCFQPFVLGLHTLPPTRELFRDACQGGTLPPRAVRWHSLALLIDFRAAAVTPVPVPNL
jgi:hypothetical protein